MINIFKVQNIVLMVSLCLNMLLFDVYQKPVTGSLEVPVLRIELYTGLLRKRCSYHYFD